MTTKVMQVVVPFDRVPEELLKDALLQVNKRWNPFYNDKGMIMGFHAPDFGAIIRCAFVQAEVDEETGEIGNILKFQYDQMVRKDGPIADPREHATPNAMCVVVEERTDGYYIWGVDEWRPVIWDHRSKVQGVTITGVTGGWAKKIGANPIDTALQELASEAGFEIDKTSIKEVNIHSPNRAYEEACNVVVLATFRRKGEVIPDTSSHDVILDQVAYRIDKFPVGLDALVNSALWAVARYLGLVRPR